MTTGLIILATVIGYLLGSIPCGVIISKKFARTDVLQVGSGKTGTTNVLRAAGKKAAALALLLDIGKGAISVAIAHLIFTNKWAISGGALSWRDLAKVLAAAAAISGHNWSGFLKFKGGRGVATLMGSLLALYWPAGVLGGICVLGLGIRTKYMSLGSIIGAVTAFILLMAFYVLKVQFYSPVPPLEYVIFAMAGAIFIYVMHRDNILRLFSGTERRIGEKVNTETITTSQDPK
jgi:glycerol-3-phosphate acyltransferase PlsY